MDNAVFFLVTTKGREEGNAMQQCLKGRSWLVKVSCLTKGNNSFAQQSS